MRKVQILCAAFVAVLAFGVASVATAAAEELPVWLKNGAEVTKAESALIDGTVILHHKPPNLLGGGEITTECASQFHGTVGPGMKDEITKVLDSKGKESNLECVVTSSTNGICKAGAAVSVNPDNLPWKTELLLTGGKTVDDLLGSPGYSTKCSSIETLCTHEEESSFVENEANGAVLEFTAANTASCSDGGTTTLLGKGTVLGFTISTVPVEELPVWLKNGAELTAAEPSLVDGSVILHHKPPNLLGGGEITVECKGQFHGTVGPGMKDEITKVLDEKGKESNLECVVTSSTNSICKAGTAVSVNPDNLPWKTELLLAGGKIVDDLLGNPGYSTKCASIEVLCAHEEKATWLENSANGAVFEFTAANTASCSDGGTSTTLGKGTVLGFTVSKVVK